MVILPEVERMPFVPAPKPLWFLLDHQAQEELKKAQWRWYGNKLIPPGAPSPLTETTEQLSVIMAQPPENSEHLKAT